MKNGERTCAFWSQNNFKVRLLSSVRKTPNGCKQSVALEDDMGMCHCWATSDGLCVNIITDNEYPESTAYNLIGEVIMDFVNTFDNE